MPWSGCVCSRLRLGALTAFAVLFLRIGVGGAETFPLSIGTSGTNSGRLEVRSSDGATFACDYIPGYAPFCTLPEGSTTARITSGSLVTVSAAGSEVDAAGLLSGSGPAAGCGKSACRFVMTGPASLQADFSAANGPSSTLTIGFDGDGRGSTTADVAVCRNNVAGPTTCTLTYLPGTTTHLLATPASAARFVGFTSSTGALPACATSSECDVTLTSSMTIVVTFRALASVAVTPAAASAVIGGSPQPFAAVATFTDGVTAPIAAGTGTWIGEEPMPTARAWAGAAALNGLIYATGGDDAVQATATVTAYDSAARAWTPACTVRRRGRWPRET